MVGAGDHSMYLDCIMVVATLGWIGVKSPRF